MSGDGTHVRGLAGRGWAWGVGGRVAAVAVIVCGWPATIVVCTAMHIWSNRSLCASLLLTSVPAVSARQRPGELSAKGMLQSGRQMCCLKVVGQAVAWEALAQKEGWPGSGPGPVGGLGGSLLLLLVCSSARVPAQMPFECQLAIAANLFKYEWITPAWKIYSGRSSCDAPLACQKHILMRSLQERPRHH